MRFQLFSTHAVDALPAALSKADVTGQVFVDRILSIQEKQEEDAQARRVDPPAPSICLFGCAEDGKSVLMIVEGYYPSVRYVPVNGTSVPVSSLISRISNHIRVDTSRLQALRRTRKQSFRAKKFYGWEPDIPENAASVTTPPPVKEHTVQIVYVPTFAHRQRAIRMSESIVGYELVEAKVAAEAQFLDEIGMNVSQWIEIDDRMIRHASRTVRRSHCDIEATINVSALLASHKQSDETTDEKTDRGNTDENADENADENTDENTDEKEQASSNAAANQIAPFLCCSFDIECSSETGGFPQSDRDSVVMVSLNYWRYGSIPTGDTIEREILCLGSCDDIEGARVSSFETERELLETVRDRIVERNPHIKIGYNVSRFDYRFMCERAEHLRCQRFFYQSMFIAEECKYGLTSLSSNALGHNELYHLHRTGGVCIDLHMVVKTNYQFPKYTLDYVSEHFLGHRKVDMPMNELFAAFRLGGTSADRARVAVYCAKDSDLPIQLLHHLKVIASQIEMSSVTRTQVRDLNLRGQQIKVFQQILHYAHREGYVINSHTSVKGEYKGATVITPITGFYQDPVAVLDFMSLYPSIIMQYNLCYCTKVTRDEYKNLEGVQYDRYVMHSGREHVFVRDVHGVLPMLLSELLRYRKETKRAMASARSAEERDLLDVRQRAIKVSANSVYGFLGVDEGILPNKDIAEMVTFIGRQLIDRTKDLVESMENAQVVYGDTDSVMLRYLDEEKVSLESAFKRSEVLASRITEELNRNDARNCIVLEFEKVMYPCLFVEKKRYAAMSYEKLGKPPKEDVKGMCTQRRDNAAVLRKVVHDVMYKGLLSEMTIEAAEARLQEHLDRLVRNENPFEDYIETRSVGKRDAYANPEAVASMRVVDAMERRNPGSAPSSGERIEIVVTEHRSKKVTDRVEHPDYAREQGLRVDRLHVLEMIDRNIGKIFECVKNSTYTVRITRARNALMDERTERETKARFKSLLQPGRNQAQRVAQSIIDEDKSASLVSTTKEDAPTQGPSAKTQGAPTQGAPMQDDPTQDAPTQGAPMQDDPTQDAHMQSAPTQDAPTQDASMQSAQGATPSAPAPRVPTANRPTPPMRSDFDRAPKKRRTKGQLMGFASLEKFLTK